MKTKIMKLVTSKKCWREINTTIGAYVESEKQINTYKLVLSIMLYVFVRSKMPWGMFFFKCYCFFIWSAVSLIIKTWAIDKGNFLYINTSRNRL